MGKIDSSVALLRTLAQVATEADCMWGQTNADAVAGEGSPPARRVEVLLLDAAEARTLLPRLCALLSEAEMARYERFVLESARHEFAVGRAVLRLLLGRRLCCAPRQVPLGFDSHGKPVLSAPSPPPVAFNVSHSHGLIALAVGNVQDIGIDVERIDTDADVVELAATAWGSAAAAGLAAIPAGAERQRAFFERWVRFEAEAKLDGRGIGRAHREPVLGGLCVTSFAATVRGHAFAGAIAGRVPCRIDPYTWLHRDHVMGLLGR